MIAAPIALLLPIVAAWQVLIASGVRSRLPWVASGSRPLTFALAFCCGVGASSLTTFAWSVAASGIGPGFVAADVALWVTVALVARRRGRTTAAGVSSRSLLVTPARVAVWVVFAAVALLAGATALAEYQASPYGHADATLIWNLKARFMLHGGAAWSEFVGVPWSGPSHPLLLSASVARLWAYAGETTMAPFLFGAGTAMAIVAALFGALRDNWARAAVAATLVIAPATFSRSVAAQIADLPLALFVLAALIVFVEATRSQSVDGSDSTAGATRPQESDAGDPAAAGTRHTDVSPGAQTTHGIQPAQTLLAGILAGLAAWTKNEGVVVLCVLAVIVSWVSWRRRSPAWIAFAIGALPAVLAVAWLKLMLAPVSPEYFAESSLASTRAALTNPAHLALVTGLAVAHGARWGAWGIGVFPVMLAAAAAVATTRAGHVARLVLPVVLVALTAYYAIWLLSALDPRWLVSTTADRLLLHVWPALVMAACSAPLPWLSPAGNLER